MDIKPLYTVVEIANRGSFAAAADKLGVSVSTISLQVSALEKKLDKTLFDRSTRPTSITAAGRTFVEKAGKLISQWEALYGEADRTSLRNALKIGAVHTVVSSTLPPALLELQQQAPDISTRLVTGLTNELVDKVARQSLDCAIVTIPDYLPNEIECFAFARQPLVVMAYDNAAGKNAKTILEKNPYVRFSPDAQVARIIDNLLRERGIEVSSSMQIDTLDAVVSLVSHGLGVSVIPQFSCAPDLPKRVRLVQFGKPFVYREIGLIVNKDSQASAEIELLLSILREERN